MLRQLYLAKDTKISCSNKVQRITEVRASLWAEASQQYKLQQQQLYGEWTVCAVVPALVITGFLGAGKTTLLQHLLAAAG